MFIIYIFLVLSSAIIDFNGLGMAQKLEPIGGKGGMQWDDGTSYDFITKVSIKAGGGRKGIHAIQINYFKDGKPINGSIHGDLGEGFTHTLEFDQSKSEYIVSIDCYYDGIMQALQFKTNLKTSEMIGFPKGTKKSLGAEGKIIDSFHGFAGKFLNSLGAYVKAPPPVKSELVGGLYGGQYWDDGPNYDSVRKVSVTFTYSVIRSISTDYEKDGQVISSNHGNKNGETQEFVIDYPNEYLISVEGTHDTLPNDGYLAIRSLIFTTSTGRTSPTYGYVSGTPFKLERQGNAIISFHGREGEAADALGVYFKQ